MITSPSPEKFETLNHFPRILYVLAVILPSAQISNLLFVDIITHLYRLAYQFFEILYFF